MSHPSSLPDKIRTACAAAWLRLLCEARADYRWHTSSVRPARPPPLSPYVSRDLLRRGEETLRPLALDEVLDAFEAEERGRHGQP